MCTSIFYQNRQLDYFLARTMDFSLPLDSKLIFIPQNYTFYQNKPVEAYKTSYCFVGAGCYASEYLFADGLNERGLGVASLYFSNDANYVDRKETGKKGVAPHNLVSYLLGTCANVQDVKEELANISLLKEKNQILDVVPPLHWIVSDSKGKCIVVEPVETGIQIYENTVGVMTNSPSYPWHLTNLNQYVNLSNKNDKVCNYQEFVAKGNGAGAGALGLPGDYTSISRFVRAAFMNQYIEKVNSADESIYLMSHLLSSVTIPKGVKEKEDSKDDYTQFTSVMDISHLSYTINYYENNVFNQVNLKKLINEKTPQEFNCSKEVTINQLI